MWILIILWVLSRHLISPFSLMLSAEAPLSSGWVNHLLQRSLVLGRAQTMSVCDVSNQHIFYCSSVKFSKNLASCFIKLSKEMKPHLEHLYLGGDVSCHGRFSDHLLSVRYSLLISLLCFQVLMTVSSMAGT